MGGLIIPTRAVVGIPGKRLHSGGGITVIVRGKPSGDRFQKILGGFLYRLHNFHNAINLLQ